MIIHKILDKNCIDLTGLRFVLSMSITCTEQEIEAVLGFNLPAADCKTLSYHCGCNWMTDAYCTVRGEIAGFLLLVLSTLHLIRTTELNRYRKTCQISACGNIQRNNQN